MWNWNIRIVSNKSEWRGSTRGHGCGPNTGNEPHNEMPQRGSVAKLWNCDGFKLIRVLMELLVAGLFLYLPHSLLLKRN